MCYEISDKRPTEKMKEAQFFSPFNLATIVFVPLFYSLLSCRRTLLRTFVLAILGSFFSLFFLKISFNLFVCFDLFPEHWQLTLVQLFGLIFLI